MESVVVWAVSVIPVLVALAAVQMCNQLDNQQNMAYQQPLLSRLATSLI